MTLQENYDAEALNRILSGDNFIFLFLKSIIISVDPLTDVNMNLSRVYDYRSEVKFLSCV